MPDFSELIVGQPEYTPNIIRLGGGVPIRHPAACSGRSRPFYVFLDQPGVGLATRNR